MTARARVQRFRSIEEMNAAAPLDPRGGDFDRFLRHCARYWQLAPRIYPRGVFRCRSIQEAEAARSRHRLAGRAGQEAADGTVWGER